MELKVLNHKGAESSYHVLDKAMIDNQNEIKALKDIIKALLKAFDKHQKDHDENVKSIADLSNFMKTNCKIHDT